MKDREDATGGKSPALRRVVLPLLAASAVLALLVAFAVGLVPRAVEAGQESSDGPAGQVVVLKKATLAGVTKEDYFALYVMASKGDKAGATGMIQQGKAFLLEAGTRIRVMKNHLVNVEIQVEDGKTGGRLGWVPTSIFR